MTAPEIVVAIGGMALCGLVGFIFGELQGRIHAAREYTDRMLAERNRTTVG